MQYRVISADNHIIEPRNLFIDRVPARYRDQAPRVVRGKDGGDGWSLDGSIPDSTISLPWGLGSVNPGARIRIAPRGLRWAITMARLTSRTWHRMVSTLRWSTPRWCIARTPASRTANSRWSV